MARAGRPPERAVVAAAAPATAAAGTVVFGLFATVNDFRVVLFWNAFLFIPAIVVVLLMPDEYRERAAIS